MPRNLGEAQKLTARLWLKMEHETRIATDAIHGEIVALDADMFIEYLTMHSQNEAEVCNVSLRNLHALGRWRDSNTKGLQASTQRGDENSTGRVITSWKKPGKSHTARARKVVVVVGTVMVVIRRTHTGGVIACKRERC